MTAHLHHNHSLPVLITSIGEVGLQMTHLDAAEGSAGNISVFVQSLEDWDERFQETAQLTLPVAVPHLQDGWVLVSGTGRRLRDLGSQPLESLCLLRIQPGGQTATLFAGSSIRPTSEMNSHLAIHNDQRSAAPLPFHAIVHAQPPYISFLSHLPEYADTPSFNRRLLRWEPETILIFPEGIGMVPFQVPGSPAQMAATLTALRQHKAIVWQKHGVVARSSDSVAKAADYIEYAETAARYELMNRQMGEPSSGLSPEEIRAICELYHIEQGYF